VIELRDGIKKSDNQLVILMRSQLLEDPNASPKQKITERARSRCTLPSSQHLKGVEGCLGASGWD
jgi:hypothetical protein